MGDDSDQGWPNKPGKRDLEKTVEFINDARIALGEAEELFPTGTPEFTALAKKLASAHLDLRMVLGALLVLEREAQ